MRGESRSLEHNDHPFFLGWSGRGDQVKEGRWLITSPTELESQAPNSYFCGIIAETKKWPGPLPFMGNEVGSRVLEPIIGWEYGPHGKKQINTVEHIDCRTEALNLLRSNSSLDSESY